MFKIEFILPPPSPSVFPVTSIDEKFNLQYRFMLRFNCSYSF